MSRYSSIFLAIKVKLVFSQFIDWDPNCGNFLGTSTWKKFQILHKHNRFIPSLSLYRNQIDTETISEKFLIFWKKTM